MFSDDVQPVLVFSGELQLVSPSYLAGVSIFQQISAGFGVSDDGSASLEVYGDFFFFL